MASSKAKKTLNLAAVLDLNEASTLRSKLMDMRGSNVAIDASGVERLGTLCVQVLLSAARTWNEDKLSFTFTKVSEVFQRTMQVIGVDIEHLLAKEIRQ